ncbi:MAG: DUF4010 domain-containing protein, partial [Hyphomicrobium sp.]|nr:DUF4010 domain-containing protein [Hyphomicrobium sp.]
KETINSGGAVALGAAFVVYAVIFAFFRYREVAHDGTFGATTVVAAMLTFALGAFAILGSMEVAAAGGVAVTALLAWKSLLHTWLRRMTQEELRSGLVLLAMTFILLPVLPNRTVDPWDALNPHEIWLMTIMIAFISFVGYVAVKLAGDRQGIAITGLAGGLASSTAVTLTLAKVASENAEQARLLAAGVLFASAVMAGRVLAIAGVINPTVLVAIALPIGAVGAALALGALALMLRSAGGEADHGERSIALKNPFELGTVLQFGAILAAVILATKVLTGLVGSAGAYLVAAVSGIADVDAITLSMARSAGGGGATVAVAAVAIFIAVVVNTITKAVMAWSIGGSAMGWPMAIVSALSIVAGALGLMFGAR